MLLDLPTAARYNAWANKRLYAVAEQLSAEELAKDRKGFFKSILGTLNHMLLADLIYRERLEKKPTTFTRLDEIIYDNFGELKSAQFDQDDWYKNFFLKRLLVCSVICVLAPAKNPLFLLQKRPGTKIVPGKPKSYLIKISRCPPNTNSRSR